MGSINISIYVRTEDLTVYADNQEGLHQKVREAFEKELFRIKEGISKASASPQIPVILEEVQEESVHKGLSKKTKEDDEDNLYKVKERKFKSKR